MAKQQWHKKSLSFESKKKTPEEEQLELAISALLNASQKVPESMTERLATLKKERTTNKVNATKIIYDGTEYDSRREANFAKALKEANIPFDYQVEIELVEGFKLENENVNPIKIIVDFCVASEWMVDVKGIILQPFPIKWKLLKNKLRDTHKYFIVDKDSKIRDFIIIAKRDSWKESI